MSLQLQNLLVQSLATSWLRRLMIRGARLLGSQRAPGNRLEQLRPQFIVEALEVLLDHELH